LKQITNRSWSLIRTSLIVSRVVVYGLLSAALAGIYLAAVAAAGGLSGAGLGLSVPVAATVIAAAVLLPVRGRLQCRVDRLFFGDRGAPYAAMTRLGRQVEEMTTAEPVLSSVVTVAAGSLRLPYAAVELRVGDRWVPTAAWGQAPPQMAAFPLTFQRETAGRLLAGQRAAGERLSPDDERLLASLARQVAPAAHAVALRQVLDASRAGQVTAREEERRRLRRDLHDGVGPTMAGLTLGLDTARAMSAGRPKLEELLSGLKAESQRAVTDIRRIIYGLRPRMTSLTSRAWPSESFVMRSSMFSLARSARNFPARSMALSSSTIRPSICSACVVYRMRCDSATMPSSTSSQRSACPASR
jgi:signal transduction histidine kinase